MVSIITAAYNAERFIGETIGAVLAQTHTDWEMIVVNDGSKDATASVVQGFIEREIAERGTSRIRLISQPNGGTAKARNTALAAAQGRYVAILDADDLWDAQYLQKQLAFMAAQGATLVYGSYRRIDERGAEILRPLIATPRTDWRDMTWLNRVGCLTGLYDTQGTGGKLFFDESLKSLLDDYDYWLRIVQKCGVAYGNPEVLASYRIFAHQTTSKKRKLIGVHWRFYRQHMKMGVVESALHTIYWGMAGVLNLCASRGAVRWRAPRTSMARRRFCGGLSACASCLSTPLHFAPCENRNSLSRGAK